MNARYSLELIVAFVAVLHEALDAVASPDTPLIISQGEASFNAKATDLVARKLIEIEIRKTFRERILHTICAHLIDVVHVVLTRSRSAAAVGS